MSKVSLRKALDQLGYFGAALIYTWCLMSVYGEMASQIL